MSNWKGGEETKPDWDTFYISLAHVIAQRSVDESTVHGACLVSSDHRLLSIGYNGPIRGSKPELEDLTKRPNKYFSMIHAEENCIINYHGSSSDLKNSTMYITGEPCHRCLRMIIQKGIKRICFGNVGSKCVDEEDRIAKEILLKSMHKANINIIYEKHNSEKVKDILNKALNYIEHKKKQV